MRRTVIAGCGAAALRCILLRVRTQAQRGCRSGSTGGGLSCNLAIYLTAYCTPRRALWTSRCDCWIRNCLRRGVSRSVGVQGSRWRKRTPLVLACFGLTTRWMGRTADAGTVGALQGRRAERRLALQ
ncbi:hypothetical protein C8R45DRAFT_497067 [Mycena sanguinolenta]|nr:hypothetical protein C8R45DRAFT_497067 [Mycena sanguinolenta]